MIEESPRSPEAASFRQAVDSGEYFLHVVPSGAVVRIVDLEGMGDHGGVPIVASVAGERARREIRAHLDRLGRLELRDFVCAA